MSRTTRLSFPVLSLAALAFVAILSVPTHAQAPPSNDPHGHGAPGMMGRGGEDAPEMVLERMTKRLNLTPEQQKMLKPILEDNATKLREMRQKHLAGMQGQPAGPDPEMRKQMMTLREESDAKIEKILTPAQTEEWKKMRAEARERMGQHMKGSPGEDMPPPPSPQN